ncbi:hypothetical protein ACRRTK_022340 [Alexandromys fortis]
MLLMMLIRSSEERAGERSLCVPTSKLLYVAGETAQWLGMLAEDVGSVPSPTQEDVGSVPSPTQEDVGSVPSPTQLLTFLASDSVTTRHT